MSVQRCVWSPVRTLGEIQTNRLGASHVTAVLPLSCSHTIPGTYQRQPAISVATSSHASNNYLKH